MLDGIQNAIIAFMTTCITIIVIIVVVVELAPVVFDAASEMPSLRLQITAILGFFAVVAAGIVTAMQS